MSNRPSDAVGPVPKRTRPLPVPGIWFPEKSRKTSGRPLGFLTGDWSFQFYVLPFFFFRSTPPGHLPLGSQTQGTRPFRDRVKEVDILLLTGTGTRKRDFSGTTKGTSRDPTSFGGPVTRGRSGGGLSVRGYQGKSRGITGDRCFFYQTLNDRSFERSRYGCRVSGGTMDDSPCPCEWWSTCTNRSTRCRYCQ